MRRLILIMIALITTPVLADNVNIIKNDDSPELRQCVNACRDKADNSEREACEVICVKAEIKRKQKNQTATTPSGK